MDFLVHLNENHVAHKERWNRIFIKTLKTVKQFPNTKMSTNFDSRHSRETLKPQKGCWGFMYNDLQDTIIEIRQHVRPNQTNHVFVQCLITGITVLCLPLRHKFLGSILGPSGSAQRTSGSHI